jgi:type I restriction-modification system DNA methylase subunit
MSDMNKEQERSALHAAIWRIANDVRGAVDGWDFKQYVLSTLFYRCISENFASYIEADDDSTLFKKETNNNVLTEAHIDQIMQWFDSKTDVEHVAKSVSVAAIAANDYNLSVSSYVEAKDNREVVAITQLNAALKSTVAKIDKLRTDIDAIVAEIEGEERHA